MCYYCFIGVKMCRIHRPFAISVSTSKFLIIRMYEHKSNKKTTDDKRRLNLRLSVYFVVPLKVRSDGKLHPQRRPGDWLDVDWQLELWQLVDVFVDCLSTLWHADELANLVWVQVVETFPREVLLLDFADDLLWNLLELTQWTHRLPPTSDRKR